LVFIGYGLKIPEKKLDDLADLDLEGKTVDYLRWFALEVSAFLKGCLYACLQTYLLQFP
jgi:hypothetical protein